MISPELYVQESQKIRDVLEESNDYLERIVETLVSSLDFTKESERQAAIRAENAELATIEAIREAKGSDLQAAGNIDGTAKEAGTSLGRSLSERFGGRDFVNRFRTGLSAGLAGLGARLLRGGPLAAIGVAFGDEIAKFLSDNVGDMLDDAGFTSSTVTAVEESLEKYTAPAITGAGIGMVFKRTLPGALAGIIISRLGLTQEGFINTANKIGDEIKEQLGIELPEVEEIGGFLEQGATGAGIGYLASLLIGRLKIPLTIAGFIADYLGLDREKLNLFAEETAQQVENLLQPAVETTSVVDTAALNERLGMAATGLNLPSNANVPMPTLDQFYATPLYNEQGEVVGRLSDKLGLSGTFDTSIAPEAFTAAINLRSSFGQGIDLEQLKALSYGQLDSLMGELENDIESIDKFLNLDPEIQKRFVANENDLINLGLIRNLAQEKYDVIKEERGDLQPRVYTGDLINDFLTNLMVPGISSRPADQSGELGEDEYRRQLIEDSERLRRDIQGRARRSEERRQRRLNIPFQLQERGIQPLEAYPAQVQPFTGSNEVSQLSRDLKRQSSIAMIAPVTNNFNNVDNSTNVSGGGGRGAPAQLPAGASKSYDRSEQLYA